MYKEIEVKNFVSFIRRNLKTILFSSIIFSILFLGGSLTAKYFSNDATTEENQKENLDLQIEQIQDLEFDELTERQQNLYTDYLFEEAYYFRFYVEHEDYTAFTAPYLLEEVLLKQEVIDYVEEQAGVKFNIDPEIAIDVTKEESNVIHEIHVGTGNKTMNRKFANALITALEEGATPFLNNKRFYILSESAMLTEVVPEVGFINQVETIGPNQIIYYIMMTIIGLVLGFVFGITIALVKIPFSKKAHELYEFIQAPSDVYMNFNNKDNIIKYDELNHAILYPETLKKAVLTDISTSDLVRNKFISDVENEWSIIDLFNDVTELDKNTEYDEVILMVSRNLTNKDWYESQRMQLRSYAAIVKIIEI